jgi:hypothetical protein
MHSSTLMDGAVWDGKEAKGYAASYKSVEASQFF